MGDYLDLSDEVRGQNGFDPATEDDNHQALRRKVQIMHILRLTIHPGDGRVPLSLADACDEVGISYRTWHHWAAEGHTAAGMAEITTVINDEIRQLILPELPKIIKGMLTMATGQIPANSKVSTLTARDVAAMYDRLAKLVRLEDAGQYEGHKVTEDEFVQNYQPKPLPIGAVVQGDAQFNFLYQGSNQSAPTFGDMTDPVVIDDEDTDDAGPV